MGGHGLGGRFTTLEGLLKNVAEKLDNNPFLVSTSYILSIIGYSNTNLATFNVQGDTSRCSLGYIDFKSKVALLAYTLLDEVRG